MRGGVPGGRSGSRAAWRWAMLLAASFLAGLAAVGLLLLVPDDGRREEGAASPFAPPPPAPAQPAPGLPAAAPPRLAVVVDDLGYNPSADAGWLDVPAPVTVAVIPFGPSSRMMASSAKSRGFGVLIHVPMEPDSPSEDRTAEFRLRAGMGAGEIDALFARMRENIPEAAGASNHMGSAFTADPTAMAHFAQALAKRGLFFLDSLTSPRSVAADAVRSAGAPAIRRDVFLDAEGGAAAHARQWDAAVAAARERGYAVLVCHARPETLRALLEFLPDLQKAGVRPARLDELPGLEKR